MLNALGHAHINSATLGVARGIAFTPAQSQTIACLGRSVTRAVNAVLQTLGSCIGNSRVGRCYRLAPCRGRSVDAARGNPDRGARQILAVSAGSSNVVRVRNQRPPKRCAKEDVMPWRPAFGRSTGVALQNSAPAIPHAVYALRPSVCNRHGQKTRPGPSLPLSVNAG